MLEIDLLLHLSLTDFIDVVSLARILGHRVAELENKLKTLEVSGLWSLQGEHPSTVSLTCKSRCFNQVIGDLISIKRDGKVKFKLCRK